MEQDPLNLLLVDIDHAVGSLVQPVLASSKLFQPALACVDQIEAALEWLRQREADLILLVLEPSALQALELVRGLQRHAPAVPLVVVLGADDPQLARQLIRAGVQDCLPGPALDTAQLDRAICYALERSVLRRSADEPAATTPLADELALLRAVVEGSSDALFVKDLQGRFLLVNARMATILGASPDEIVGQTASSFVSPELAAEIQRAERTVLEGGAEAHEQLLVDARAERSYILTWRALRQGDGQPVGLIGEAHDVTLQQRVERNQHFLSEVGRVLASSLDYDTLLPRIARLLVPTLGDWCTLDIVEAGSEQEIRRVAVAAADPQKEGTLRQIQQDFPLTPVTQQLYREALRSGKVLKMSLADWRQVSPQLDERQRLFLSLDPRFGMAAPMVARGRSIGVLNVGTSRAAGYDQVDMTLLEEVARHAALAIENARLYSTGQQALQDRDAFLSIAAHEIKTPVAALLGYTQLLQRRFEQQQTLSQRDQRAFNSIAEQAGRLHRLTNGLLDFSRLQAGQFSIERRPVDLGVLVHRFVQEQRATLQSHVLHITELEEPLMVEGDELRLRQVFDNLLSNAVKYSPDGSPIYIDIQCQDGSAVVSFRDHGIGIPAESLPQLFSVFYRADNARLQGMTGVGVGLAVVKQLIAAHGGTVEVESVEAQGSTFRIILPLLGA